MTHRDRVRTTIAAEIHAAALECPDVTALQDHDGDDLSFAGFERCVLDAAAGFVSAGIAPGDRVAVWAPNAAQTAVAMFGAALAGAALVPLNTRYRGHEVTDIITRSRSRIIVTNTTFLGRSFAKEALTAVPGTPVVAIGDPPPQGAISWSAFVRRGTPRLAREVRSRLATQTGEETVLIQYTSGTTGKPKGAMLRQGPMLATAATWADVAGMGPGDVYPVTYPLAHVGGFKTGVLTPIVARATSVLFPVVDKMSLIEAVWQRRATILNGPPPVLRTLLAAVADGSMPRPDRIRTVVTGSTIVPPQLVRAISDELGAADVLIGYGLTEASGVCTMTRRGDPVELVCHTLGRPIDGVRVRIATPEKPGAAALTGGPAEDAPGPVGEIEVSGPNVMVGYLDDPAATPAATHDGWLRTGDVGWIGADGYVRASGRMTDMALVGGFNVYPAEVEHVLLEHPAVREAGVVGVPDDRLGEVVVAFVVAQTGAPVPDDVAPLHRWCSQRLANYKVPRRIWLLDSLPRGSLGKVLKADLRSRAAELLRP